jgi:hypothetical protein
MAIGVNRISASEGQSELATMIGFPVEEAVAALATFSLEFRFIILQPPHSVIIMCIVWLICIYGVLQP